MEVSILPSADPHNHSCRCHDPCIQMENEMNGWVLVLYYNRQLEYVQGYIFPFRGMILVMIDGTFSGASSASDTNLYRLKFNNDWYEEIPVYDHWTEELAYWIDIS